ncbi:MAG TPA: acylneuraminate cytidylyltransferase family protein [Phycisphaerales bacterium]|nr:acylneuraminate cytidylyltransferase family protein [Phycisphaerales bacterium]
MTTAAAEKSRALSRQRPAIAVILGRAGSKGVPGKNMMPIAGRPCAAWTIDHALAAETVGEIIVSTDDPRLAELAREMGVRAVPRSAELASDRATVDAAAREAVKQWESGSAGDPRLPIVILYANVPVRPAGLIDRAVGRMVATGCDSVQSYAPVGKMHPWWTARLDSETGSVRPWEGEVLNHNVYRRQDLPPAFIPDGGVLVMSRRALFLEIPNVQPGPHACFGHDRRGVVTGEGEVIDIDTPTDAIVADAILGGVHAHR